jgi:hypothetical protein
MQGIKIIFVISFCFFVHAGVLAQTHSSVIDETALAYFQDSYEVCRDQFRSLASKIKQEVSRTQISRLPISSQRDEDLTIDLCYLPALKRTKLIIISCGVHGVEGFAGSAVQRMFMTEFLPKIDWGNTEGFYTVTGDFSGFIGKIVPGKFYIPMIFEYGTMDSHTTMGSVKSLHNMIIENQGFYYGYKTKNDEIEVKKKFREMYFPSSDEWRSEAIRQAREVFPLMIKRYQALDIK